MSRKHSQASANPKTSSSQQPTLTYAQLAGNNSGKSSNASTPASVTPAPAAPSPAASQSTAAPASQPNPPKSFSAAAKQDNRQRTPTNGTGNQSNSNGGNASGVSGHGGAGAGAARGGNANNNNNSNATSGGPGARNREAAVRLPSRNSVSSAATPNIQFGSLNKQARPQTPPTAQKQNSGAASATSGGAMPPNMAKPAAKPSFGSIKSHGDDSHSGNAGNKRSGNANNNNSGNAAESNSRQHHGRQQQHGQQQNHQQQQQRSGSRASNQGRPSQNYSGFKHGGPKGAPKPQETAASSDSSAPFHPQHHEGGAPNHGGGHHNQSQGHQPNPPMSVAMPGAPAPASAPHSSSSSMSGQQQQHQGGPHYGGAPYRGQGHQHVRPPQAQGHNNAPYKPQANAHYPPHHHMGASQQMSQPMAFPMPGPGQPPMQQAIMTTQPGMPPMQGWMPPPQFAYMQVGGPGYDQYYRAPHGSAGPPPHSMYGMPNYSMPAPQHAGPTPMGPGGMIPGPMSGAPMPGMTAAPMGAQQHPPHHSGNLSASAQAFVPGSRRPVRIVNPNTNEEVDLSSQRLRSVSAASSAPRNAASGTASPALGVSEKRDASGTPAELSSTDEPAKPKFKIPVNKAIKIVDPNLVAKSDKKDEAKVEGKSSASDMPAPSVKEEVKETKPEAEAVTDLTEALAKTSIEAEVKAEEAQAAIATEKASTEPTVPVVSAENVPEPETAAESETAAEPEAVSESKVETVVETPAAVKEEAEATTEVKAEAEVKTKVEAETKAEDEAETKVEAEAEVDEDDEDVEQNEEQEEEEEEGEIAEAEESAPQTPTPLTGRSRQVTFSEPVTPSVRTMSSTEIADLYSGEKDAPTLVGEILKYPRVFLERFNGLCKPPAGFNLEIVNTDERRSSDRGSGMRRSMSGSGRSRDQQMSSSNVMSGFGGMGNFRHVNSTSPHAHAPLGTSEERFRQSTHEMKSRMDSAPRSGSSMGGRPPSGQYRNNLGSNRESRESRGGRTGGRGRGRGRGRGGSQHGGDRYGGGPGGQNDLPTDFKPLVKSENRYVAKALRVGKNAVEDDMQEEVYHRRIQALLNKLTPDNFPDVSSELLEWGNKSIKETDGRILRHLVMLVFEKATDEPVWASIYARLCFRLIVDINKDISDENVLNKDGNLMTGMQLVRKYLLTKCQDDFERGWKVEMPDDMESAEYYEAVKIKRRGLGLIQFIGELFLLDILSERIIHNCIRRLLANYESPEGEETESMAKLLTTVGKKMDHPEAESFMKVYFQRIQAMSVNKKLDSRIRFQLKDVIDLRQNKWVSRAANANTGPKTIAEIHEEIEKAKAQEEKMRRAASSAGRRSESHAGRGEGPGGRRSGWNTVGGPSGSGRSEQSQRTGDMTGFGNMARSKAQRVGGNPFSVLAGGSRGWRGANSSDGRKNRDDRPRSLMLGPGGRTPSHSSRAGNNSGGDSTPVTPEPVGTSNMFDALMNEEEDSAHHASPRAEPARGGSKVPPLSSSSMSSAKDKKEAKPMDSETLARKTKGMIAEYVQLKMDSEFVECFKELEEINYQAAVYDLVNNIMERRVADVEQVVKGVALLEADAGLSVDTAIAGLSEFSEQLVDISLDAPNAFKFFGMMMAATHVPLSRVVETLGDLATNVSSPLPAGFPIVAAYLKQLVVMNGEDKTRQDIEDAQFDIVQLLNKDRRSDAEVRRSLNMQDLLPLFPKFA